MNPEQQPLNLKRYIPFVVLIALGLAVWWGINYYSNHFGTIIIAEMIPGDASVQIDDKKPGKAGRIKTTPGEHTLSVKRKGFQDTTIKVTIAENEKKVVCKLLTPTSEIGFNWMRKHPKDVAKGEGCAGEEIAKQSQKALERTPIIAKLPFIDQLYRIDYGKSEKYPNDATATAIYITYYSEAGKTQAIEIIKFWGYDPATLEIIYRTPEYDQHEH